MTATVDREAFLAARATGLGGSDVAGALGLSPFDDSTPLDVYLRKKGLASEKEDTRAMRRGRRFEQWIAEEFEEDHDVKVVRDHPMMRHHDYPWMIAHIDGQIAGKREGLECKSVGDWFRKDEWGEEGTSEVPMYYLCQCHHYLAVTGWERWHLAAWFGVTQPRYYVIERDEELIAWLIDKEAEFWGRVEAEDPPDPTNIEDCRKLWPRAQELTATELTPKIQYHISCYLELQEQLKRLKDEADTHKFAVQQQMADCEAVQTNGAVVVTLKNVATRRIDTKRLKAEQPEIATDYTNTTHSRRFLVTKAGKELVRAAKEDATHD